MYYRKYIPAETKERLMPLLEHLIYIRCSKRCISIISSSERRCNMKKVRSTSLYQIEEDLKRALLLQAVLMIAHEGIELKEKK